MGTLQVISGKIKGVQSLVHKYNSQISKETGKDNPTLKLIIEEIESIPKEEGSVDISNDRLIQMQELLKEKDKLEDQVNKLKWSLENEISNFKKIKQEKENFQRNLKKSENEKKNI